MITIESLHKSFGKKLVLNAINLHFEKGNVYGVVGENGAGKTTLFKCICGLESYQGKVKYEDVVKHPLKHPLKNVCGFLPTNPYFFSKITGQEYLQLLCNARKVVSPDFEARNIFDLPLHQYADTYSTGMKKKLALTGILLQNNEVYILDEPFNGVDIQSNMLIQAVIKHLKEQGKIIIIASHIFATLHSLCDVLHLIEEGNIQETASPDNFRRIEKQMSQNFLEDKVNLLKEWL